MENPIVRTVNHLNYPDKNGRVYCRKRNEIIKLWSVECCPMCNGSIQGDGVECVYPDLYGEESPRLAIPVPDPDFQMQWIARLLDENLIPEDPLIPVGWNPFHDTEDSE